MKLPVGEVELARKTYEPVFDALAEAPRTIGELLDLPALRAANSTARPVELAGILGRQRIGSPCQADTDGCGTYQAVQRGDGRAGGFRQEPADRRSRRALASFRRLRILRSIFSFTPNLPTHHGRAPMRSPIASSPGSTPSAVTSCARASQLPAIRRSGPNSSSRSRRSSAKRVPLWQRLGIV